MYLGETFIDYEVFLHGKAHRKDLSEAACYFIHAISLGGLHTITDLY